MLVRRITLEIYGLEQMGDYFDIKGIKIIIYEQLRLFLRLGDRVNFKFSSAINGH